MTIGEIITTLVTVSSVFGFMIGYKSSIIISKHKENKWWADMTYEDAISETPIFNKLSREYGHLR